MPRLKTLWLTVLLAAVCWAAGPAPAGAADAVSDAIEVLTDKVVKAAKLTGQSVVVSANDMYDAGSGRNVPLSEVLRDKVSAALKQRGVGVRQGASTEPQQWSVHLQWKERQGTVFLTYIARLRNRDGAGKAVSRSQKIPADAIQASLMEPDAQSFARTLVRELEKNSNYQSYRTVHLRPLNAKDDTEERKVAQYFNDWVKPALDESSLFHPVDPDSLYKQPVQQLRTRGIRRVSKTPVEKGAVPPADGGKSMSLASDMLATESEIQGDVDLGGDRVKVVAEVNDRTGDNVSTASVDFPAALLPADLLTTASSQATRQTLSRHAGYSRNGLVAEIATTRGEGVPVYNEGDKIRFFVRVNRDSYIYLFDFDSEGTAVLLYPEPGGSHPLTQAGTPVVFPDDGLSYEFEVTPPFGKDTVLVVAAEEPLKIPAGELSGEWSKATGARTKVRALGDAVAKGYAEAQVVVVTRK